MPKPILTAEIITAYQTATAKVYKPNGPNESADKFHFTKSTVAAAKKAARDYFPRHRIHFV
jgi:hypothetical protein